MKLKELIRSSLNTLKEKPSGIIHFIAIWIIISIALYDILPDNSKRQKGIETSILIGLLVTLCITLIYFRRKAVQAIRSDPDFEALTPQQKGNRFFSKLKSPKHLIASFLSNFIIFSLLGLMTLTDSEKNSDIWLCFVYGAVVALILTITKVLFWDKWRKDHDR